MDNITYRKFVCKEFQIYILYVRIYYTLTLKLHAISIIHSPSYTLINQTHFNLSYLQSGYPMNQEFKGQTILVDLLKLYKICITENSKLTGYVLN